MKKIFLFLILFLVFNFTFAQLELKKPGEVAVTWTQATISVCPPGIFGKEACEFFSILEIIQRIWNFILFIAPFVLTLEIIIGGFWFLLITFKPDARDIGWRYIKEAVVGYFVLLIISGVFTLIRFILGGPGF